MTDDLQRKEIRSEADRRWSPCEIPETEEGAVEAFARDYTRQCIACLATPVVNAVGLCGPCAFGESKTIDGNW